MLLAICVVVAEWVQLREWADVLLIAPLSANTMGKIANGLCDNLVVRFCGDEPAVAMFLLLCFRCCVQMH